MKAEWMNYLQGTSNKVYPRPCCPECSREYGATPIVYHHERYECINCGKEYNLDRKQKKWVDDMRRTKKKVEKCMFCGAYKFVVKKRRDPATHKWIVSSGHCNNCGMRMMV